MKSPVPLWVLGGLGALALWQVYSRDSSYGHEADAQGLGFDVKFSLGNTASPYAHFAPVSWKGRKVHTPDLIGEQLAYPDQQDRDDPYPTYKGDR